MNQVVILDKLFIQFRIRVYRRSADNQTAQLPVRFPVIVEVDAPALDQECEHNKARKTLRNH